MPGPGKGSKRMGKKPMPNQGIGTASFKMNLKGKRKLRSNAANAEPGPIPAGKDFNPTARGAARVRMMKRMSVKTLEKR